MDNHFLSKFPGTTTREALIAGLKQYLQALRQYGIAFEIWLDGSFATDKQDPGDIDLVVFASSSDVNAMPAPYQVSLKRLFDRANIKQTLGLDVLFAVAEDQNMRSYWRGWYGFDRDEQPKGIARIELSP
ncbi:hypothetical protein CKO36_18545 [Rhabdochromatium marinum]|nr:hypothetical protein [Rhabdochromatium marinum]